MRVWQLLSLTVLPLALSACATMSPIPGDFPPITPHQAQTGAENGKLVRWGGELIQTEPEADQTCFTMLGFPLDRDGRPRLGRQSADAGRFIACAPGFYDPTLYAAGREMTFVGTITGVVKKKVGGYGYPYPRISASRVYLWPLPEPEPRMNTVVLNGGWGWGWPGYIGPWGPRWGWGYPWW
ncbi:MAG: Slp family lipoprotein [Candidatus Igneacidithiobacillus chanchocoensis]